MADADSIDEQVYKNLQKMTVNEGDVNILLLGETGVGKSTFINSFANYLEYEDFKVAEEEKVRCLIPAKFTVTNENFEEKIVEIGKDDNENNSIAQSATLETRSYLFPVAKREINRIRLIDTPGIGDTRGIDQDNQNLEDILSYISYLENLHAICFLLKPNNSRLTVMFHYCIKQLLSRLEKSASKNIIFLFTNTRGTFYKPGDTTTALKTILSEIKSKPPYADIQFSKDNVFCLDNESFRYLVATKNGIQLGNKTSFIDSWNHSVAECWRMLYFITGQSKSSIKIAPHKVKDTMSVNDARRVILQLSHPLADIAENINDNIRALEQHNKTIQNENLSIAELSKNLYVPVINLRCKELTQPVTVCTAAKCIKIYMVSGIQKCHYEQRCHNPCYLQNVPKELIGSPELVNCWAMTNRKCRICNCDFSTHMHIYYESETFDDRINDESVKTQIQNKEAAVKEAQKLIARLETRKLGYEKEKDTIIKTMAKFAHFLQRNAIAPYNDSYKGYIEYLIDRQKSLGDSCDFQVIKYLNELLSRYEQERTVLDEALTTNTGSSVTATDVFESIEALYNLPHTGHQIKQMQFHMVRNQNNEHKNREVVMEERTPQTKQKKSGQQQRNQNKRNNKNKQNRPSLQAKNKQPDNNAERKNLQNANMHHQNNRNFQEYGQGNFQQNHPGYMPNQQRFSGFRPQFTPQQATVQYQPYQGNFAPFNQQIRPPPLMGAPVRFPGYPPNPDMFKYHQHNFPNQMNPNFHGYGQLGGEVPNNLQAPASVAKDENFDEWLKNVLGENANTNLTQKKLTNDGYNRQYNDLRKEDESSGAESSDGDLSDSRISSDPDDDEDFKEFMKQNNLEYLVKTPPNNDINRNTSKKKQTKKSTDQARGENHQKNRNWDDEHDKKKKPGKNFLSNFFGL